MTLTGWQSQATLEVRQTLWAPALEAAPVPEEVPPTEPMPETVAVDPMLAPPPKYGPMIVAPGWAQSRHKFSGKDFKVIEDGSIACPAGHRMDRQEIRFNRVGDMQMIFGIKAAICQECPLIGHCHADRSTNSRGRRIQVTRAKLPTPPALAEVPEIIVKSNARTTPLGREAIIWTDLPATEFRRQLRCNLQYQKIEIEPVSAQAKSMQSTRQLLARNQRAHRRLSWEQRLKRNQLKPKIVHWKVQLFGISSNLAQFLKQPPSKVLDHS